MLIKFDENETVPQIRPVKLNWLGKQGYTVCIDKAYKKERYIVRMYFQWNTRGNMMRLKRLWWTFWRWEASQERSDKTDSTFVLAMTFNSIKEEMC